VYQSEYYLLELLLEEVESVYDLPFYINTLHAPIVVIIVLNSFSLISMSPL
jgi:hypothetical protein